MNRKHDIYRFRYFIIIATMFVLAGCKDPNGGGDDDVGYIPAVSELEGTWNDISPGALTGGAVSTITVTSTSSGDFSATLDGKTYSGTWDFSSPPILTITVNSDTGGVLGPMFEGSYIPVTFTQTATMYSNGIMKWTNRGVDKSLKSGWYLVDPSVFKKQ